MVVDPVDAPPTTPPDVTVAIAADALLHIPEGVASASVILLPTFTAVLPEMAATVGTVSTLMFVVTTVLPQALVAVSEYVPLATVPTVNAAGFWSVDVKLFGPLHE